MRLKQLISDNGLMSWFSQLTTMLEPINQTSNPSAPIADGSTQTTPVGSSPPTSTTNPNPQNATNTHNQPLFIRPVDPETFNTVEATPTMIAAPLRNYLPYIKNQNEAMERAINDVARNQAMRRNAVLHRQKMAVFLAANVRQFVSGVVGRIRRGEAPDGDRMLVDPVMPLPKYADNIHWVSRARTLLNVEETLLEMGREAMSNPTAQQLEAAMEQFEQAARAVREAEQALVLAQSTLKEVRKKSQMLVTEINAFSRFVYTQIEPAERRRFLRTLGFVYYERAGETSEEPEISEQSETIEAPEFPELEAIGPIPHEV